MSDKFILDGHNPVEEQDLMKWGQWFEKANRIVKKDRLEVTAKRGFSKEEHNLGFVEVSTVFLGLDHSFGGGVPLLFETMVFGGKMDGELDRCSTWEAAEKMHEAMIHKVRAEGVI